MCTVTIIPQGKNEFVLTSNRDEAPNRTSLTPEMYEFNNAKMLFPKDELSGGTWIGVSDKNRVVCVLNGGFDFHERKAEYRLSRGTVAKDLLASDDISIAINNYILEGVEPFTLVIVDWNSDLCFMELVWDGTQKHFKQLPNAPKIWSSSTLYSQKMKDERLQWFNSFKSENELNSNSILDFHKTAGKENDDYGVIMNRGFVKTTSIAQVEKRGDIVDMKYYDLKEKIATTSTFNLPLIVNE